MPMSTRWFERSILISMVCLATLGPGTKLARADQIDLVTVSNLTFQAAAGNNSCPGLPGMLVPCTETFNASFEWDNTTEKLVPGTDSVSATGALSAADVAGPWTIANFVDYGGGKLGFPIEEFPGPDYIAVFDTDFETPITPGVYPYTNASMACFEAPSQCDSLFDFGVNSPTAISGTITITAAPEPSTLVLLGAGLVGATVATRREGLRG